MCDMFLQSDELAVDNGIRPMKWFIFNADKSSEAYGCPLCWNEPAIEFDSSEAAERFLQSVIDNELPDKVVADIINGMLEIKECVFYYDGGYINLSNYIAIRNGDTDELKEVGPIGS